MLHEITDAIEVFIARPGRRAVLPRKLWDLVSARYMRVIEDSIATGEEVDRAPNLGHGLSPTPMDNENIVREAREKREKDRRETGPTMEEAHGQIFKLDRP